MRPPGTRTLHKAPTALRERRVFSPPSLSALLRDAGFDDEATKWFEQQDVADVTSASQLSHHELEKIIADRATVGRVRLLHQLLSQQAQARARAHMDTLEPTASSVFGRSMLLMGASELKHANLTRLTSESVFASLMLTIAVGALIESPTVDDCVPNFGQGACERLMEGYVATFGTASAFFLGSCLVTLGAVNFFHMWRRPRRCISSPWLPSSTPPLRSSSRRAGSSSGCCPARASTPSCASRAAPRRAFTCRSSTG